MENACDNLKRDLIAVASEAKGGKPEEWHLIDGKLCYGEAAFSFADVVRFLGGNAVVKSIGSFNPPPGVKEPDGLGKAAFYAPSTAAAEVEVDCDTGEFRVLKYSVVADVGKALHYTSARAQSEGGAVMGIGHALFEEVVYDDGQIQNADPFQYRLPVMTDMPELFHASMVENEDGPGPFGSKAMAQTSIITVAPAIGNAIYDAVGVRVRSLPITPEKVLRGLGKLGSGR